MKIIRIAIVALCLPLFAAQANAQDRTEADFVKACLASSNLSKDVCECSAKKAKGELNATGFALLVAMLEGDDAKTAPLRGKAGLEQTMKAGTFMARGPAQCAREQAPK
ncbi:MAG: hypothetical protein EPO25_02435 [Gammaproteobacteria bacterium]|nr:MAG: hypothetical protein EPO25_02435 [Gammaproteobacteria bacterium]